MEIHGARFRDVGIVVEFGSFDAGHSTCSISGHDAAAMFGRAATRQRRGAASEEPAMEGVAAGTNLVRDSMSGDGEGSGEATAQPHAEGSSASGSMEPSTSGVGASASGVVTRGAPGHPRNMAEPVYKAQTCRLCNRDTLYLTRSGPSNHAVVHHGVGTAPLGMSLCRYLRRNLRRNVELFATVRLIAVSDRIQH